MSTTNIYVLQLEGGKYYIGKSNNILKRYQEHINGGASAWTNKYKPVSLIESLENVSPFEEDKKTKEYMSKYGIDNVRGGSYVSIELSEFHKDALKMEIWGAKDLCSQCGRAGHFVKDCHYKTDASGNKLQYEESSDDEWGCDFCDMTFARERDCERHELSCRNKSNGCHRCGRKGHFIRDCYAKTTVSGNIIYDDSDEDEDEDEDEDDYSD